MEGVPRLYMIGLPAKLCDGPEPDFTSAINHQIRLSYDRDPTLYSADIDALNEIRRSAMNALMLSNCTVDDCTLLKRYYVQLVRLTDKFPKLLQQEAGLQETCDDVVTAGGPTPPLKFAWKRALGGKVAGSTKTVDFGDIGFEMRSVLYNVGAAHSRLAAAQDRSPPLTSSNTQTTERTETPSNTALKIACTHLQCAAWAFEQLLGGGEANNENSKWHHRQQPPVTSRAVLEFAYNVTLAQAQECILEKSMMDGRKPLIIAKVSAMICDYFAEAIDAANRVGQEEYYLSANRLEKWRLYSAFKCRYYGAVTALFQGQHVQDQLQQMGTRVSYYRRAVNLLNRAGLISERSVIHSNMSEKDDDSADDDFYYYLNSDAGRSEKGQSAAAKELEMRRDTLSFSMDVAAAKWRAAKSENELIYHESVIPVLSDDDDSDCLKNNSTSTTSGTKHHILERVKGASLVKPIGFGIDDPELLTVVVSDSKESSNDATVISRTLFRDLVPAATRHLANIYRTEKKNLEENVRSMCETADDELSTFNETLHLDCLEIFKEHDNEKNDVIDLPEQLINCCAAYQAQLQQQRQENGLPSDEEEDQLDIAMGQLTSAVQSVDNMLDEIDRHLKIEEYGDSEYRRMLGRPYDYSAARMQELRREASRYREAHVGRARDSWVTLSRAVRNRRRRDLKLLALPMDQLSARLPPSRPTKTSIAAEVAALNSFADSSSAAESSDQNDDFDSNDNKSGRLQVLQRESINRLERLNLVVKKMEEVREQRHMLLSQFREEMSRDNRVVEEQDNLDILGDLKGVKDDVMAAIRNKLNVHHGNLVNLIEQNLTAQSNILEAVRLAYSRAASERRAYANAMQRRRNSVSSLLEAYESHVVSNGGTPTEISNDTMTALPNSGLLPDSVLAERCTKGLDFYQRLLVNVSKLLQRVKGTCQVQTEQRDQIIQQHRQWEAEAQQSDDDQISIVGGLDDLLASVSGNVDNSDHHQEDLAALIENFGNNSILNKPPAPLGGVQWDQQHNHLRRLSPLGSEQQQQFHQYRHPQVKLPSSTVNINAAEYYKYYYENQLVDKSFGNQDSNVHASIAQQQTQPLSVSVMATQASYSLGTTAYTMIGSTTVMTPINSTTTCIQSSMPFSSSVPYNYYNYQLPSATSVVSTSLSSSYSSYIPVSGSSNEASTIAIMNALRLTNSNNDSHNVSSPFVQSNTSNFNDDSSGSFTSAAAAVAVLQRPLQTPYASIIGSSNDSVFSSTDRFGYHHPTSALPMRQEQFYSQQNILNAGTITSSSVGVGTTGGFIPLQLTAGSGGVFTCVQSPLPLSSTLSATNISTGLVPGVGIQSSSITSGRGTSMATSLFSQPLQQQLQQYQQQQHQPQSYQQQQPQLYQQQPEQQQKQQQPQLQQQQQISQPYQHQLQQIYQQLPQLATTSENTSNSMYYSPLQQQQSSQLYQLQQQLQPAVGHQASMMTNRQQLPSLSNGGIGGSNYYQQVQYNQSGPMAGVSPLNTTHTNLNDYYYQQPQTVALNQQQQYYLQQQIPSVVSSRIAAAQYTPVLNLLDNDDELLSGPPPIEPEKLSCSDTASASSSLSLSKSSKNDQ